MFIHKKLENVNEIHLTVETFESDIKNDTINDANDTNKDLKNNNVNKKQQKLKIETREKNTKNRFYFF